MTDCRVVFTPSGLEGVVAAGTTILEAARDLGADLDTVCGGRGICGRCQIHPSVGRFAKWQLDSEPTALSEPGPLETDYHGNRPMLPGARLGCATAIRGDVVIDVPASSQRHRQVVRKSVDLTGVVVDAAFTLAYLELPADELGEVNSVADSLTEALASQHGYRLDAIPMHLLAALHYAVAKGERAVTVGLHRPRPDAMTSLAAIWPGFVDSAFGVAVDIGSTTIAGHLCDLDTGEVVASAGRMNPQIRFGEDLMSRVSYVMMNPGGERELTSAVRIALDELLGELVDQAGVDRNRVLDVVLVGNPIMHHLVLGIDPTPLGAAPFVLATAEPVHCRAGDLELDASFASVYVGPCIAGHVGADTAAVILSEGPHRSETTQLLVDVGTNAEIVLGDRHQQFAASSPTGPAFEGAQISCGQRATVGAVERVRIDRDSLEPRLRVIGSDLWSDEPGFAEATRRSGVTGVCGSGIIEVMAELYLAKVILPDGTIDGSLAERTERVVGDGRTFSYVLHDDGASRLLITQNDVRAIQLAKAALRAGIDLLMEHAGLADIDDIRLAGAFGSHIDPLYAMVLGLVPDCPLAGVRSVGNSAGAGAARALLSRAERFDMETAVRSVTKIETATEPRFQELFVAAMQFPHASASRRHLAELVELPEPMAAASAGRDRGRRRVRPSTSSEETTS